LRRPGRLGSCCRSRLPVTAALELARSRKKTRHLCDRFGIQDQGRKRLVLTLLADSLGHLVRAHDREVNGRSVLTSSKCQILGVQFDVRIGLKRQEHVADHASVCLRAQ